MSFFKKNIKDGPFLIAEVGQNHQGDFNLALEYIDVFAAAGANAIKFQKRNNTFLFDEESYSKPYDSENAFAATYGAHREKLEFTEEEMLKLSIACKEKGVFFMCTPFDEPSLKYLDDIDTDILKVASFDLGNLPLIDKMAQTKRPIVISVGGGRSSHIKGSVEHILSYHDEVAVLHCVSEYPCPHNHLGLSEIARLTREFPSVVVGSSDHFNGILSGPVAYFMGARVFEKHVTLNRSNKGTDHSFALEADGFKKFSRDLNRIEEMLPPKNEEELGNEFVFQKLGKSLVASEKIKKGSSFTLQNLSGKILHEKMLAVRESVFLIGKSSKIDYEIGDPILVSEMKN